MVSVSVCLSVRQCPGECVVMVYIVQCDGTYFLAHTLPSKQRKFDTAVACLGCRSLLMVEPLRVVHCALF